jgi:outer membrane protein assembly factor BamB
MRILLYSLLGFCYLVSCTKRKTALVWEQNFPVIGSQSSPRTIDINHDGTDDIIMGACKNEYIPNDQAVLALDGKTGNLLWTTDAPDQVYGSATLIDITEDGNQDVIISGRWGYLRALDGQNGKTIWNYTYTDSIDPILKHTKYNFYNSVLIPDQNGDGKEDLLIQNGGNHRAAPDDSIHRYPGILMVMDSKSGKILAADSMPDGKESYMSPLYFKSRQGIDYIVFGTGGETFNGHLYVAPLRDLISKNLQNAKIVATDASGHGYIAPPVIVDFNNDGEPDIACISHSSKITVTDGKSLNTLWEKQIPHTESSNSFSVGKYNDDDIPDLFTFASKGIWPQSTGSVQICLDGKDGSLIYTDSLGCAGFSSPVSYDVNSDGIEEVIISINEYDCARGYTSENLLQITNKLIAINIKTHQVQLIDQAAGFKNIYSTPRICDLDHDGYLDIIYNQYYSHNYDLLSFLGMRIKRIQSSIKMKKEIRWGGYMGSQNNGIY